MKTKNKTRFLILGLLSEGPLSGYEIKKIVDARFSYFWNESFGQIYPELALLEREGLINTTETSGKTRKESKTFTITPQGLELLKEWITMPVEKEVVRFEILLKLYFSSLVAPEVMEDHIREFEISHKRQMEMFKIFEKQIRDSMDLHDNHQEVLMVLNFGQKVWQSYLEWSQEALMQLREKKKKGIL